MAHSKITQAITEESPVVLGDLMYSADMGRNLPSASMLVYDLVTELIHVGEMLPPQDRYTLKQFADYALNNRAAIANAGSLQPLEVMLLLVLLEEHKRLEHINYELRIEIERLKADLL